MDVIAELKAMKCDPGPVHSPNECDMEQPCACVVYGAAVDEIKRLREAVAYAHSQGFQWPSDPMPPCVVGEPVSVEDQRKYGVIR